VLPFHFDIGWHACAGSTDSPLCDWPGLLFRAAKSSWALVSASPAAQIP